MLSRRHLSMLLLGMVQGTILFLLWRAGIVAPDFFPLHLGGRLLLAGESPYGPAATAELMRLWAAPEPFPRAGIAYPLPLLLLVVPLACLPFPLAAALWGGMGAGLAGLVSRLQHHGLLLPLLFWPFFWSIVIGQATLVWLGLCGLLLLGMQQRRAWLVGVCLALLPLKPQTGLLFALAGCWWAWREDRRGLLWAAGVGGMLAGAAFLLQPGWLAAWLDQLRVYRAAVQPISLLPWVLVLLPACWRFTWWAKLALLQVFLFPLVRQTYGIDPYTVVPLLLVWTQIPGRAALVGAGLSWLWPILVVTGNGEVATSLTLLAPLTLIAAWQSWGASWRSRFGTAAKQG